jgi:hypothetical protein
MPQRQIVREGLQQPAQTTGKTAFPTTGGAECGAVVPQDAQFDAQLKEVIAIWPTLSEAMRTRILAQIRSMARRDGQLKPD